MLNPILQILENLAPHTSVQHWHYGRHSDSDIRIRIHISCEFGCIFFASNEFGSGFGYSYSDTNTDSDIRTITRHVAFFYRGDRPLDTQTLVITVSVHTAVAFSIDSDLGVPSDRIFYLPHPYPHPNFGYGNGYYRV